MTAIKRGTARRLGLRKVWTNGYVTFSRKLSEEQAAEFRRVIEAYKPMLNASFEYRTEPMPKPLRRLMDKLAGGR